MGFMESQWHVWQQQTARFHQSYNQAAACSQQASPANNCPVGRGIG